VTLSRQERATGLVLGADVGRYISLPAPTGHPRSALFDAVVPLLSKSPCAISFSGGWDSSLILAVAVHAAREHGFPLPLPVTIRFPGHASADESGWQELVVKHLGLKDWKRIEVTDELDFLGETACAGLVAHGQLWPPNVHFHAPIFAAARGAAVLTGFDGDGLFGTWRWSRPWSVLLRLEPARPRDVLRLAAALAPTPLRRTLLMACSEQPRVTWLKPDAERRFRRHFASEAAGEPRRWDRRVAWFAQRRLLTLTVRSLDMLADGHGTQVVHPLLDPRFLAAIATHGGRGGYGGRARTVRTLFGDLLPDQLLTRRTKAVFGRALWGPRARTFAAAWDGSGIDVELVDIGALRRSWTLPSPPLGAATLLQGAWLSAQHK
jgi:asparagine synthase (glutamine-hydrolysing)